MERTELPIAVFDSGLGGISVLRALVQRLPGEDFLYFGDSANAPYGVRPVAEVRRLTQDVIGRLYDRGIKAAVIACNTATSAAIGPLRAAFPDIPVIGIEREDQYIHSISTDNRKGGYEAARLLAGHG